MKGQRKKYYTDFRLQGILIIALISLELFLSIISLLYIYLKFNVIIDESLFKAHVKVGQSAYTPYIDAVVTTIVLAVIINLIALLIAHYGWGRYVREVLSEFRTHLQDITALNLSAIEKESRVRHHVLGFVAKWKTLERNRCYRIRSLCNSIELEENRRLNKSELLSKLETMRTLLNSSASSFTQHTS